MTQVKLFHVVGEVQLHYTRKHIPLTNYKITSPDDAHAAFKKMFDQNTIEHKESVFAMYLDRANRVLGFAQISTGGVAGSVVDPKIVFQYALLLNASGLILAHNHPSGELKPSKSDEKLTEKISSIGSMIEIQLLDHLIITLNDYRSVVN